VNCIGTTIDGQPCQGHARSDSEYCFFHDPASVKNRREAQRKGGSNRSRLEAMPAPPTEFDLKDSGKIGDLLNYVTNRLVSGQLEVKVAYAVGYIANLALRVNDVRELAEQIAQAKHGRQSQRLGDFGIDGDGIELSELPEEEARKVLSKLREEDLINLLTGYSSSKQAIRQLRLVTSRALRPTGIVATMPVERH
jgi:hypothetical protein